MSWLNPVFSPYILPAVLRRSCCFQVRSDGSPDESPHYCFFQFHAGSALFPDFHLYSWKDSFQVRLPSGRAVSLFHQTVQTISPALCVRFPAGTHNWSAFRLRCFRKFPWMLPHGCPDNFPVVQGRTMLCSEDFRPPP